MAKYKNAEATGIVISHWLSTRYALDYLGIFERLNNPNFNVTEFGNIRAEAGSNGFVLTVKQWVERTGAIGIISTPGRYGGTYAHRDIALEFASWLSAELKYYMVRELQRLKADENERLQLNWTLQRTLSKINYRIHTDAIMNISHRWNSISVGSTRTNEKKANFHHLDSFFVPKAVRNRLNISRWIKPAFG